MFNYVEQSNQYKNWSNADKQRLVDLAAKAGSPGFLFDLECRANPTTAESILENKKILACAASYASSWINEDLDI